MGALTPEIVAELLAKGMTQSAIAKEYDVSRQYVHTLAKQAGHHPEDRSFVTQHIPWQGLTAEHKNNSIYHALRSHARAQLRGDEIVKGQSRVRLLAMYRKLVRFNQVIDFDPNQEPIPSLSNTGGFSYKPREDSDGDYIIKIKPGVHLTEEGKKIWRMPSDLPM